MGMRVGLAISDEEGRVAFPLVVIENGSDLSARILKLLQDRKTADSKEKVTEIVIGESRDYKGRPNVILAASQDLKKELEAAGFESARIVPFVQHRQLDRATALERIRGRHISTFDLVDEDELAEGTARAERELPEHVETTLEWAIVVADR